MIYLNKAVKKKGTELVPLMWSLSLPLVADATCASISGAEGLLPEEWCAGTPT